MGFLKDLSKWLGGGRAKKDNVRSAAIKLKVFNKRLMRQTKKLETTAQQAKDKAVALRRQGDADGSTFHARNYLQIKKQARAVDAFRTNLEGLQFKLEQANAVNDVAQIMGGIQQSLSQLKSQLSIPQLTEMMGQLDMDMEDFAVTQEIAAEGMSNITLDTAVSDGDVKNFLGEIDAELQVEVGGALPSVVPEGKISELEKELDRLKQND
ncbi:MAG: Snf7 family protein [Candidatus Lokiarchaeota archaeon]|nr:Snf7 family protein [Candidatus Lokiarchaeota archaeon]